MLEHKTRGKGGKKSKLKDCRKKVETANSASINLHKKESMQGDQEDIPSLIIREFVLIQILEFS